MRIAIILIVISYNFGCSPNSKLTDSDLIPGNNKDIYVLSKLIQNHLKSENRKDFNLDTLIKYDTANQISENFRKLEIKLNGGYISVYFNFSDTRGEQTINLTSEEIKLMNSLKWINRKFNKEYNGEIQFDHGEQFYRIRKIIINEENTATNSYKQ